MQNSRVIRACRFPWQFQRNDWQAQLCIVMLEFLRTPKRDWEWIWRCDGETGALEVLGSENSVLESYSLRSQARSLWDRARARSVIRHDIWVLYEHYCRTPMTNTGLWLNACPADAVLLLPVPSLPYFFSLIQMAWLWHAIIYLKYVAFILFLIEANS